MSFKSTGQPWYERIDLTAAESTRNDFRARCPGCDAHYLFGPLFDHHPRMCRNCGVSLREWIMHRYIYLIDFDHAPVLVRNIVASLDPLPEQEASDRLLELMEFLGVDEIY